jgi:hypothetical protein
MSESILRNPLAGLLLLAGAAGGPYLWYETEIGQTGQSIVSSATSRLSTGQPTDTQQAGQELSLMKAGGSATDGRSANYQDPFNRHIVGLQQLPVTSLAEVLRFDITPDWVMGRFPRVSTVLSELQLDGLRAPLITGSTPGDLAGTITYYFDRYKQLKRVNIHASVGDPTALVAQLQNGYQMIQEPSLGGNLYVIKWNGKPASLLHLAPASVLYNDLPYGRFNIFLELNQAGLEYGLSGEAQQLVNAGRQTNRW